eukprot:gnl/TRDRNA2_/TRDRNA2_164934_c4_seq2.p2 gnl/TRDRNA2_/TRDRNA2_164934_c4~~gnl/TRDRNA2_/TRDRNA2_164934_c4_seq2.p2  ORF type:complete len:118 (+),score=21.91 gnl/TRDRNA2_/TRDRNA2_164934_c4_seq2:158-511(+)
MFRMSVHALMILFDLLTNGRQSEATSHLKTALRLGRQSPELWNGMGACRFSTGRLQQADSCFRAALSLRPSYKDAADNLAAVQAELQATTKVRGAPASQEEPKEKEGKKSKRTRKKG